MKLEYHPCAAINNNRQRQESSVDATTWKFDEKQDIYMNGKYLSTNCFLATKGKWVILQWVNLVNTTLNTESVNKTSQETNWPYVPPDTTPWEGVGVISLVYLPKLHSLDLIVRTHHANQMQGHLAE